MNWNKKLLRYLNFNVPFAVILLIIIGFISISSAVEINQVDSGALRFLQKQAVSVGLGLLIIFILQAFDYRIFKEYAVLIYVFMLVLLTATLFLGRGVSGGAHWIGIGGFNLQTSELSKIMLILVLAAVIDNNSDDMGYLKGMFLPSIIAFIPFALVILQNDLGTALVLFFIYLLMLFAGGGNFKYMASVFGGGFLFIVSLITAHVFFNTPLPFLKEYQLNRLIVFINPNIDPHGSGYNIIQSIIALGSGRTFGKGLFAGTQNQLNFLPEKHTDFIFSVIGEEFGFVGTAVVISLFLFLLWQFLSIAENARDRYGYLVMIGIIAMFLFHVLENIGMTMGIMPITGIPLPFISYGGTFMLTSLTAVAIAININLRKNKLMF
ncbi:MAG: rod shape determining protein RodA [Halanaerobium sp. 4-GBenrich]|jgi:rod shape determining protein RodA|uniref:Rod shape determining protein RodA n=1 Tax=Halanaerobium congolense TaxID=54121 RepID=A0A1G6N477_9FIRM|nr:rod shape-determining protein RodA [Halanaerobium congolense]KXS50172.1 MAG: rod shape determining protein RodA [Halanaerobium sp. T82-1]ODS51021.1 MAG: rod shape determining protein RodA [Halanaerobium sp. 4-GBenrich]OEG62777.1 MAG: rod shape-determining protein RodA [Halanaerobium sp. MDAL1]PUU93183.1 MAG: rod shape determining protein RodA [Halanaerobium sp.]PTX17499.1 rod shape determining protein RodA [Halanaerobium congolense]